MLRATAHDGTHEGDSSFFPNRDISVPYEEGMTFEDLKKAWTGLLVTLNYDGESIEEEVSQIKGFWVVDEAGFQFVSDLWDAIDPGGDSATYRANRAAKRYLSQHYKQIGEPATG